MAMSTNPATPNKDPLPEPPASSEPDEGPVVVPPMILLAEETYLRDLPELLKTHYGEFVAYHGDKLYAFSKDKTALQFRCFNEGLPDDEYIVYRIDENGQDIRGPIYLPWYWIF
jgi:hypothetical protein